MRRAHLALLLLLPVIALCGHHKHPTKQAHRAHHQHEDYDEDDDEQEHENKDVSETNGHSLVLDLSSLSVLAALKIKFVVVALIVVAVFMLITKGYNTKCLFGNCRPNYSTYGYYPYVDYNYVGYEVPSSAYMASASSSSPYRRPGAMTGASHPKDSHHLSDLTARVWNSIDLAGMAFSALNVHEDDCRRKLVCQADRAAASNPLLRAALSWFSASLARYRTDRSRVGAGPGVGAEWRQEDPCEEMYPRCLHHDLPPALGGPSPGLSPDLSLVAPTYSYLGADLHQHQPQLHAGHPGLPVHAVYSVHAGHDHIPSPMVPAELAGVGAEEAWRPQVHYRPEYSYEYPRSPFGEQHVAESPSPAGHPLPLASGESLDVLPPADLPLPAPHLPRHPTSVVGEVLLEAVASSAATTNSASTVTVLAPAQINEDASRNAASQLSATEASTLNSTQPETGAPVLVTSGAPWRGDLPPELRVPATDTSDSAEAQAPANTSTPASTPVVWRRLLFGVPNMNRTKQHSSD